MALGAHVVPVLVPAGPVQDVVGRDPLVRVEMEPALSSLLGGPTVPAGAQGLIPASGKRDEILLQRKGAEGVRDLVVGRLAVRSFGPHEELAVALEERGSDPEVRQLLSIEC